MDLSELGVEIAPADTGEVTDETETTDTGTDDTSTEAATDTDSADNVDPDAVDPNADGTDKVEKTGDGRSIPAKYKELFKTDKDLRAMYFQSQEFKKHFESPGKAAEMLEQLSALGGFEGINATQAEFVEIDRMFATGEKALLDKFLSKPENVEGFAKLGSALYDQYQKLDEAGWTHSVAKTMSETLNHNGIPQDLSTLSALLKDSPEALAVVKKISSLVSGIDKLATEAPAKPKIDPEREKLNQERAEFEKGKADLFMDGVNAQVVTHLEKGIRDSLAPYIKGKTLDKDSYGLIQANINAELVKLMNADPAFTSHKDAVLKSGDKTRITTFYETRLSKHLPEATKKVVRAFGSIGTASSSASAAQAATKTAPVANGVVKLSKAPSADQIDYKKTGDMLFDGKCYLKSGKMAQWDL